LKVGATTYDYGSGIISGFSNYGKVVLMYLRQDQEFMQRCLRVNIGFYKEHPWPLL
jgi:hypothetical protein